MRTTRAFTLVELLVVVTVVAILAAIVLPVFNRAKEQAMASVCLSNFKQVSLSTMLYQTDYDDRFALSRYSTEINATSATDRTWVQLVLPYGREFRIFRCPSDYTSRPESRAIFDADLLPGDTFSRYYTVSKRTNLGYNYLYLSPLIQTQTYISPLSRSQTEINDVANMLVYGGSVHEVSEDGRPQGGGSYLIVPPCRYAQVGNEVIDTFRLSDVPNSALFRGELSWGVLPGEEPKPRASTGGLWPWHAEHLTVAFADGHFRRITLDRASQGCDVLPAWAGLVHDRSRYLWDLD
ncbi:MAG: prepilin-type N-terminal cleavage/methylation domain-containing protein [Armatimonadetes bacterium]|nr:prepilin-type N-terminal cleavage/methylation domain-containing protein [Armatimonadota bacterium]